MVEKRFPLVQQTLVEPVQLNLEFLNQNLKLNRIRAQVLPLALGDTNQTSSCYVDQTLLGMAPLLPPKSPTSAKVEVVRDVKGDDLLIDSVDVILIEVEGFEIDVLKGMRILLTQISQ